MNRFSVIAFGFMVLMGLTTGVFAQSMGAQVFTDPLDGLRKVRVPITQARENQGIAWAMTSEGRTVAYDSARQFPVTPNEAERLKIFLFVSYGQPVRQASPANPIDPFGFVYTEQVDDDEIIYVERTAYRWADYVDVREASVATIEMLLNNGGQLSRGGNGQPMVTVQLPGSASRFEITPNLSRSISPFATVEVPLALTSSTLVSAANRQIAVGGGGAGGVGPGGNPQTPNEIGDTRAAAEWLFYYDQVYLWNLYVAEEILDADTGGEYLMSLQPDALRQEIPNFYERLLDFRDQLAADEHEENLAFYARMDARELERERYDEWRAQEAENILEFAREQRRRIEGTEVIVENRAFIISAEPLRRVQEGRINIVTQSQIITPYDLLTSDGELKSPYTAE